MTEAGAADRDLLAAAEEALSGSWGAVTLTDAARLASSSRSRVLRATVTGGSADLPQSVVVKTHDPQSAPEASVREPAALALLGDLGCLAAPSLLAVSSSPPLVVISDLGDHGRVSDALLWGSGEEATASVLRWAAALASIQSATLGVEPVFAAALDRDAHRLGADSPPSDDTQAMLARSADQLLDQVPRLGLVPPPAALDELRQLDDLLPRDPALRALTPADACPDNNLLTAEGLRLIDFESAQVRHVAWDAAYLTVPWPSCWCSWRLPTEVAETALQRWRERCAAPVQGPDFDSALRTATIGWSMASVGWSLQQAIDDEPWGFDPAEDALAAPRRALVQHRLQGVVAIGDGRLPALTALADHLLAAVESSWGAVDLPLAPAWRS